MVDYPKDSAKHLSQVEVAQGYIESGAKRHGDKYQVLPKLDEKTAAATNTHLDRPFKIKDYGATSFTDAVARHFYGNSEGYKGLTHEQRNVVLNIYLALASQGLDVNVCRPSDEWKFDLAAGTYEATLDGKKVSGKLEYVKDKRERERVIAGTRDQLAGLQRRITAEAQNVLAQSDSTMERTTDVRKAISIGSLSNLMATLGNVNESGYRARKALLQKELEEGATKDQLVDDTITGINHYLELAGHADQKIDPQTGKGYQGTAEQNKAWVKFIEDVLKPGLPEYLRPKMSREELIAQQELGHILRRDFVTFLGRDYDFPTVQVSVFSNGENGDIDYIVKVTDESGEETSFNGRLEKDFQGNVEDVYRAFVESHADFFGRHVKTPEEPTPVEPSPADRRRERRETRQAERRERRQAGAQGPAASAPEAAEKPKTKLEQKTEFHRALDAYREEAIRNYANEVQLYAGRYGAENGLDPVTVELQAVPREFEEEADYALVIKSGRFREDVPVKVKNPTAIMEALAAKDADYYKKDPREVVEFDLTDADAEVSQALERLKGKKDRQITRDVARERRQADRGRARDARGARTAEEVETPGPSETTPAVAEAAPTVAEAAPQTPDKTAERLTAVGANPENPEESFTLEGITFSHLRSFADAVGYGASELKSALEIQVNREGEIPYVVSYKNGPKEVGEAWKKVPCADLAKLKSVLKQVRKEQKRYEQTS